MPRFIKDMIRVGTNKDRLVGIPLPEHRRLGSRNQTMIILIIVFVLSAFTLFLQNPGQYYFSASITSVKSLKEDVDGTSTSTSTSTNRNEEGSDSGGGDLFPHAYSTNGTSANYTWQGSTSVWIPPEGALYLYPSDIRRIFQPENTLWIGDSTGRQEYQTMFSLMHTQNITDDNVLGFDRDATFLDKNKDKCKRACNGPSHCPARIIPKKYNPTNGGPWIQIVPEEPTPRRVFWDLGQVRGTDHNCSIFTTEKQPITTNGSSSPWSTFAMENEATGKFDAMITNCISSTLFRLKEHKELLEREYSVVILSQGVWERKDVCKIPNVTEATMVVEVLESLRALSGPSFFVIWKTHGPKKGSVKVLGDKGDKVIDPVRNWFMEEQPPYMDLSDFRWAVRDRSYGALRIKGDDGVHWGLNARLLSIEMISRIVDSKQKRQGKNPDRDSVI